MDLSILVVSVVGLAVSGGCLVFGVRLARRSRHKRDVVPKIKVEAKPTLIGASDDMSEPEMEKESSLKDVAKGVIAWFRKEKEDIQKKTGIGRKDEV